MIEKKRLPCCPHRLSLPDGKLGDIIARAASSGGILEEVPGFGFPGVGLIGGKKARGGDAPFRVAERERVVYRLSQAPPNCGALLKYLGVTGEELGALTPALLETGDWKKGSFRPYNIGVTPPYPSG
jgi:hypothetical protein